MSKTAMTFCYFAYGSNMLTEWLQARSRCPSARPIGCAIADGWGIEFSKPSKDSSGKATLSKKNGCQTAGVLFEIQEDERDRLDRVEGYPYGYDRCDVFSVRLVRR